MWARLSHTLAPLTKITPSRVKFKWTKIEQYAFNEIKWIWARDTVLAYPDFNKEFKFQTDARKFQLLAVIIQKVKMTTLYIRKLTDAKIR